MAHGPYKALSKRIQYQFLPSPFWQLTVQINKLSLESSKITMRQKYSLLSQQEQQTTISLNYKPKISFSPDGKDALDTNPI